MIQAISKELRFTFLQLSAYESPLHERSYPISFRINPIHGNYEVKQGDHGYTFAVLPRVFQRITESSADCGYIYVSYAQLSNIGGISL